MLTFILYLAAFILFVLATIGISHPRLNFVAAGLACWVLVSLLAAFPKG